MKKLQKFGKILLGISITILVIGLIFMVWDTNSDTGTGNSIVRSGIILTIVSVLLLGYSED